MTLQEILDSINNFVPSALTDAQIVKELNELQKQLFREHPLPEVVDKFTTAAGVAFYPFPVGCQEDRVKWLTVGGTYYDYQAPHETALERFWTTISGQIMLHPTPGSEVDCMLCYTPSPNELSASNLDAVPSYPEDYHMVFVYHGRKVAAESLQDVALINNYEREKVQLVNKADREFRKARQKGMSFYVQRHA